MATDRTVITGRQSAVGHPTAPTIDPSIYDILAQTSANQLGNSTAQKDLEAVMASLTGASASVPPINLDPNYLFGMTPDQVMGVAKERNTANYQNMLNAAQGIKTVQDMKGVPDARALNNRMLEGEQARQSALELADFNKNAQMHVAKIAGEANQDPVKKLQIAAWNKVQAKDPNDPPSEMDRQLAGNLIADSAKPADALKMLTNMKIYVDSGLMDPETANTLSKSLTETILRGGKEATQNSDVPPKRSGSKALEIPNVTVPQDQVKGTKVTPAIAKALLQEAGSPEGARKLAKERGLAF